MNADDSPLYTEMAAALFAESLAKVDTIGDILAWSA